MPSSSPSQSLSTQELLRRVPIFQELSARARRRLADLAVQRDYPAGTVLMEEGAVGLGLDLLVAGSVEVHRGDGAARHLLGTLGVGDILGEMALIDEQPRTASATTLGATECLLIARESFQEAMADEPEIAAALLPVVVERLRDLELRSAARPLAPGASHPAPETTVRADDRTTDGTTGEAGAPPRTPWLLRAARWQLAAGVTALEGLGEATDRAGAFARTFAEESRLDEADDTTTWLRRAPRGLALAMRAMLEPGDRRRRG